MLQLDPEEVEDILANGGDVLVFTWPEGVNVTASFSGIRVETDR